MINGIPNLSVNVAKLANHPKASAMEKHPQAELIKQVVDGLAVPQANRAYGWWDGDLKTLMEHPEWEWRAKPAEPEKVYPVTQMNDDELTRAQYTGCYEHEQLIAIANAALRHAVDNGYLVLPPECSPSARDMAIAQAVAAETVREIYTHSTRSQSEAIRAASQNTGRLAEIIESVKP